MTTWPSEEKVSTLLNVLTSYRAILKNPSVNLWKYILGFFPGKENLNSPIVPDGVLPDMCSQFTKEESFGDPAQYNPQITSHQESYQVTLGDGSRVTIEPGKLLGSGSYGKTYLATLKQNNNLITEIALKIVSVRSEKTSNPRFFKFLKNTRNTRNLKNNSIKGFSEIITSLDNNAVKEAWITSYLFCINRQNSLQNKKLLYADPYKINRHAKIPKIMLAATYKNSKNEEEVLMAMSKMNINLEKFILQAEKFKPAQKDEGTPNLLYAFKLYMFNIACTLDTLQSEIQFVHGDFHCENAMLVENSGIVYPCIIDFGFTCITLKKGDYNKFRYAFDKTLPQRTEFNPSRDLLNLIWSIDALCRPTVESERDNKIGQQICAWCEKKLIDAKIPDYRHEELLKKYTRILKEHSLGDKIPRRNIESIIGAVEDLFNRDINKRKLENEFPNEIDYAGLYDYLLAYKPQPYWACYTFQSNAIYPSFIPENFALSIALELGLELNTNKRKR